MPKELVLGGLPQEVLQLEDDEGCTPQEGSLLAFKPQSRGLWWSRLSNQTVMLWPLLHVLSRLSPEIKRSVTAGLQKTFDSLPRFRYLERGRGTSERHAITYPTVIPLESLMTPRALTPRTRISALDGQMASSARTVLWCQHWNVVADVPVFNSFLGNVRFPEVGGGWETF